MSLYSRHIFPRICDWVMRDPRLGPLRRDALVDLHVQAQVAQVVVAEGLTRTEVTQLVQPVKARRPTPNRRPEPVTVDLGDCVVTVRWKKMSETTALQALRKAAKQIQERERPDQAA